MKSILYILLPYLNTFQSFTIEDIKFKGLFEETENNLNKEKTEDIYHLSNILKSFRLSEDYHLNGFTYCIKEINSQEELQSLKEKLKVAINIIRYKLFSKEERSQFSFSQTELYIFELTENEWKSKAKKLRSGNEFFWYKGIKDSEERINLHWPRSKIFPQKPQSSMAYLQIKDDYFLINILNKTRWKSTNYKESERLRLIRSIEHYNRSYAEGAGIDDRDRILSLSAGFEALLNLPEINIQQSLRSGIITLLGDISDLSNWTLEFYNLRSKIIHGEEVSTIPREREQSSNKKRKKTPSLFFKHSEGEYEYIRNLIIGQAIFQRCLEIILDQRATRYVDDIRDILEPNEVHVKRIEEKIKKLKSISTIKDWYEADILKEISELRTQNYTAKPEKIISIGLSLMKLFKDYLNNKKCSLDKEIDAILKFKGKYLDLSFKYYEIDEAFDKLYLKNKIKKVGVEEWAFENAVNNFIVFSSHYLSSFDGEVK